MQNISAWIGEKSTTTLRSHASILIEFKFNLLVIILSPTLLRHTHTIQFKSLLSENHIGSPQIRYNSVAIFFAIAFLIFSFALYNDIVLLTSRYQKISTFDILASSLNQFSHRYRDNFKRDNYRERRNTELNPWDNVKPVTKNKQRD